MSSKIIETTFDPWQEIQQHQSQSNLDKQFGATATFLGSMRDFNDDADVSEMTLEHYPDMTARYLDKLEQEARQNGRYLIA